MMHWQSPCRFCAARIAESCGADRRVMRRGSPSHDVRNLMGHRKNVRLDVGTIDAIHCYVGVETGSGAKPASPLMWALSCSDKIQIPPSRREVCHRHMDGMCASSGRTASANTSLALCRDGKPYVGSRRRRRHGYRSGIWAWEHFPRDPTARIRRRETLILETDFETSDGAVMLIDSTPLRFRDRRSYDASRRPTQENRCQTGMTTTHRD